MVFIAIVNLLGSLDEKIENNEKIIAETIGLCDLKYKQLLPMCAKIQLGEIMGKRLLEKKINTVVFDRNGYLYHGLVKAMADGTRKAGIAF